MKEIRADGGPAFPVGSSVSLHMTGMSLRDWFAGMAACGILLGKEPSGSPYGDISKNIAATAYTVADAMLAERNKCNE